MGTIGDDDSSDLIRHAVILAGGKGTRLRPLTFSLPKPLIPIGEIPIIDIILAQLASAGVDRITIAAGYMAGIIMAYISARKDELITVADVHVETEPLGTAGALALIKPPDESFLVMNGDLLTSLKFTDLSLRHKETGADITIAACRKTHQVGLGVLESDESGRLISYSEKPSSSYLASMGIYAMKPNIIGLIRKGERIDLPQLVLRAVKDGMNVQVYEFHGYWRDIGTPEEYGQALDDFHGQDPMRKLTVDYGNKKN